MHIQNERTAERGDLIHHRKRDSLARWIGFRHPTRSGRKLGHRQPNRLHILHPKFVSKLKGKLTKSLFLQIAFELSP